LVFRKKRLSPKLKNARRYSLQMQECRAKISIGSSMQKIVHWLVSYQKLLSRPLKSQIFGNYKAIKRRCINIHQAEINAVIDKIWLLFFFCKDLAINV